jgi:hypothetical protein
MCWTDPCPKVQAKRSGGHETYAVATRRLPLRSAADHPTSDQLIVASLQRHDIAQLPQVEGEASAMRKVKAYLIDCFHIDNAEVRADRGKL